MEKDTLSLNAHKFFTADPTEKSSESGFFGWILAIEKASKKVASSHFQALGDDGPPRHEAVRFIGNPNMAFPITLAHEKSHNVTANLSLNAQDAAIKQTSANRAPRLVHVTFLSLVGATGVMPLHYSRLILDRLRQKDTALNDFLAIFTHRLVALFYRAWIKYRFPYQALQAQLKNQVDPISQVVQHLAGLGQSAAPDIKAYYAGHFTRRIANAQNLSAILSDYLRIPILIKQFQGRWLTIPLEERSRLSTVPILNAFKTSTGDSRTRLGEGILLGKRVWDLQSAIIVKMGPIRRSTYQQMIPGTKKHEAIQALVSRYVPQHIHVRLEFHVRDDNHQGFMLNGTAQLKRTSWLGAPSIQSSQLFKNTSSPLICLIARYELT